LSILTEDLLFTSILERCISLVKNLSNLIGFLDVFTKKVFKIELRLNQINAQNTSLDIF